MDTDSQRSHLSSFTMKLMDKFHSPKIKRTPSKKGKPAEVSVKIPEKPVNKEATDRFLPEGYPLPLDLEQQAVEFMSTSAVASRSQRQKNLSWLEEKEKEVVSALRYFKTIVDKMAIDKKVLEMLPGSASKVLEAILPLVQNDPRIQHSSALSSCYSRVYQSLANLIRWSDQVMLEGVNSEDKEMVTTVKGVIKAVLDGVKELVRLTIEKQGRPSPTSPVKPSSPASKPDGPAELPLTDREVEILNKTTGMSQSTELLPDATDEEVAPPKPPLPGIRVVDNSPPPALPPKKRQSAPSPTRVAVVAPMSRATSGSSLPVGINRQDFDVDCYAQRRLSGGSHSYGGESPRLSPCSSIGKLSKSDEQLSSLDRDSGQCSRNTSCETLDHYDPDYEFLQQDLSNADQIPQQTAWNLSPLPESLGESGSPFLGPPFQLPLGGHPQPDGPLAPGQQTDTPPALPEKKRRSAASQTADGSGCRVSYERHPSQYDNISGEDLQSTAPIPSVPYAPFAAILPFQHGGSSAPVEFVGDFTAPESTGDPEKPPPLPEKKNKHMLAYMQLLEDYSEPQPSMFYQTPQNEHIYQQKNKLLMEVYGFSDSFSGVDSVQELAPPPALPPKQRQLEPPAGKDGHPRDPSAVSGVPGKDSRDGSERAPKSPDALESAQSEEEVDELSLIDHNEIMSRLTLKQEGDDGPDVRGGSGDILLVHATETDRKDLVLYCEAFLTTYRTFISPEELIKKLQYRYEKFSPFADTFKKRVSKNTFFVLVRVVDELCLVELTEEILKLLMELVFRLVCNGELSLARVLRKNILDKVDQKKLLRCATSSQPLAARGVAARPGTLHDFHSHEIAEQLTLLDAELFYKIEIPEVLLWAKEQNEEKSPNLTQFTEHFNNMSYWVRSIIMLQEKAQDRERLLLKFIKIMKHLRKLNNFNSYLAILSALDSAPIRRLEWQKQTSEGLAEYCTLIDSSSSFRAYRAALSEVEPPCIPYLGLILQDLTFVHLGNPDYIDGKVNFSKRWQQFNILDSMRCFQQAHYDMRRNDDIINFFNDFSDHLAEEALWELSLKIKPRNITRRKTDREEKT
ncbi:Rap guanine nucleotide exchange factor 1 [Homo sapiens]|uniref:Rap guanine nucleotide exchange factor 1 n=1 Tax=Homo sapiens TaxID=9606 RepID=RPGF1_HUMAN|nr:rap guanine nucleotide exchange factor 1 isoform a [Homo sapiens]Q13905.3 RecName: Full=Rap guanine nucleotide exchange factor 1; AltName: Full=CRK SH3-binding GNRP; AltName: Full=Guanine nucleotide-releasing factor 2; AltName: Full=Protein C3G [Homo sapiens]KAI2554364.1 Rap guanine nucleotide exchange factor 1 [Homo sapiens]KAI4008892.1 Rap guanine nucleotide exchange factor 1 [Homo sapiens]|eukprot:NP_005303.2 rap guanine nucleotide exchange factor 1 isoform a [Homo sapiens]